MPYADPDTARKKAREYTKRHRAKKKAVPGACSTGCGKPAESGFKRCSACREYMRNYKKGVRKGRPTKRNCRVCGEPTGSTRTKCDSCRVPQGKNHPNYEQRRARERERRAIAWTTVLEHYGPECVCCGETGRGFLTLDHIDGERHGAGKANGHQLHGWLIRNDFPPGFRILCYNCNSSLGFRGYCPHGSLTQVKRVGRPSQGKMSPEALKAVRRRRAVHKMAAFEAYGGARCACCGEEQIEFLTLDHTNDDGAAQRKALTGKNLGGTAAFYAWLKKNDYPQDLGLAVACMNCNAGRDRAGGVCPHQRPTPSA